MANYTTLKAAIQQVVKTNGNNEITGALLQQSLLAMIDSLGSNYQFAGIALPLTNPGTPDQNVFYIAGPGTYSNFNSFVVPDSAVGIFMYNGSWKCEFFTLSAFLRGSGINVLGTQNVHYPIHLIAGRTYVFANNLSSSVNIYLRVNQNNTNQQLVSVPANGTVEFITQREYNYLYPQGVTDVLLYEKGSLYERTLENEQDILISDNETRAFASINSLAIGNGASIHFAGNISAPNWSVNENSNHSLFIIKPGDIITIVGNRTVGAQYGVLKAYPKPVNGQRVQFCDGTSRIIVERDATSQMTAPDDAKFLCVTKTINGTDYAPASILVNGIDPFSIKTVREYLDELNSNISGILPQIITGAEITLAGTAQSYLKLNEPIELANDGDELIIDATTQVATANAAYGFSNSGVRTNSWIGVQLGKNHVGFRATDGTWLLQSKGIVSSGNVVLRILYANGNIYTYVNGSLVNTYTGQKTVRIESFGNGANGSYGYWAGKINSIKYNGQEINLYFQQIHDATVDIIYRFVQRSEIENLDTYPRGILQYDSINKHFDFYSQVGKSDKYFMFRVRLDQDDSDLVYLKEWRWSYGGYYQYNGTSFTLISQTVFDAENEMAIHFANTADYTGGIHGDERIDVSPASFIRFFADGRLISASEMTNDFSIECKSFAYMQLSTLHQTTETDGQFISGHPIVAYHYKRNTFENCSSHLENIVKFASQQSVTQYHAGLMCVGKGAGKYALLPNMITTPELTGTTNYYDADNKTIGRVDLWNPETGLRCYVDGHILDGFDDSTQVNVLQIWDRITDSKYYRRVVLSNENAKVFLTDSIIRNIQDVCFY